MRDERRNYVIVGAFVLAMLVALVGWIAVLSGRTGAAEPYHILYDNVMGLKTGTQILFEGYPVGLIEEISRVEHEGRQRFRVDVSVRRGWPIPEDSLARITAPGLLSAFAIDIQSGQSQTAIQPGGAIRGQAASNVLDVVSDVGGEVDRLLEETIQPWLEAITTDTLGIAENLAGFTRDLNSSLGRVDAMLKPENAQRVERILGNLEDMSAHVSKLSADLSQTRQTVQDLLGRVDALVAGSEDKLTHAVDDAHESLETVARHIDQIAYNLEATTRNMSEFSAQIRADPSLLLRGRELVEDGPGAK